MRVAVEVLAWSCWVAALLFVAMYAATTWWRTQMGRHLMAFMAVVLVLMSLRGASRVFGPLPAGVGLAAYAALAAVLWWRVVLLWHAQHDASRSRD